MTRAETSMVSVVAAQEPYVVLAQGEYDLANAGDLLAALNRAIAHSVADVVLDLGAVNFMDASTLGVVAHVNQVLESQSRSLVLREASVFARRILELCRLSHLLEPS